MRRPSSRISVFWPPVTPKPRRSTVVLEPLLPKKSFIVMPTCSCSSSGKVRAALFWMSSAVMTVVLAGSLRASSKKRVAPTTIASSPCENTGGAKTARAARKTDQRTGIPSGVVPDATTKVDERRQGRSPDSRVAEVLRRVHAFP